MQGHRVKINIKSTNERLEKVLQNFFLYHIGDLCDENDNQLIIQNIKESNLVIINKFLNDNKNDLFFIIGFNNTILFVKDSSLKLIQPIFSHNVQLKFYFLQNTEDNIDINITKNQMFQYPDKFDDQIDNFSKCFQINHPREDQIFQMRIAIKFCISGYLICESYFKLIEEQKNIFQTSFNKLTNQNVKKEKSNKEWTEDEYIVIKQLGNTYSSRVELIYHIETGHLYSIKKINSTDNEGTKLIKREYENYLNINHPFIPKFYGIQKKDNCLIIQYIHGKRLDKIELTTLTKKDKVTFILQLMLIIKYLYDTKFVYRDLKPNNVIIDYNNKIAFLIDFDRMININSQKRENENEFTKNFPLGFVAPEVLYGDITYKNDIYSLGRMIEYLQLEKENDEMFSLYQKCVNNQPNKRPFFYQLIELFYSIFFQFIDETFVLYFPEIQYLKGVIYYRGKQIKRDINKSIHFLSLSANQNRPDAQYMLGAIYYEGKYIERDINKSIHYFSLSANQNHPDAQFMLGVIYLAGKYTERDINKSIHYFSLSANQNHLYAQFTLGLIYLEDKYIERDINKSIYYLSLAVNQNNPIAQYILGLIYLKGKYIERDINKSIHYLSLSANQNVLDAQIKLGSIYYYGNYIDRNINKSIHYYSLAANYNRPDAQYMLGFIFLEGKYINRDINKSIHYLSLSANQNNQYAQFMLGFIYSEGKYIELDINKSIHYFSLSANQNNQYAQFSLGKVYYEGKYIERDVNKSIHYLSLSANQNNINAQHMLSLIYLEGKYINQDINKSIHYYSLAANQNDPHAQYTLGVFYFMGIYFKKNIIKAIDYFIQSSSNGFIEGHFAVGYFYHEGKHVKRDIKKSIHHYKEASTFNIQYAKNNLGVIYRYGCGDEIQPNCGLSMDYFEEAIRRFKDKVSMYNLAHIYIYEDKNKSRLKKSIEFLIESNKQNFSPSTELLCIAVIKLFGFNIEIILEELNKLTEKSKKLPNLIYNMIIDKKLLYEPNYENYYQSLSTVNYLYYFNNEIISTELFNRKEPVLKTKKTGKNITQEFYDGFGIHDHC